ncbi:unnamed protein product [Oncorhynchus mykiss]|uniref:Ig-like domain-containing protein n=1 Tax=Oncorhynchus mykiss TaxID=8022 RepID=A0A060XP00_ONCMY|nr:unnamed protein product [Oncorhynchus mykiss]
MISPYIHSSVYELEWFDISSPIPLFVIVFPADCRFNEVSIFSRPFCLCLSLPPLSLSCISPGGLDPTSVSAASPNPRSVSVRPSPQLSLPILNQSFSLDCSGSFPGLPVLWYKDGQVVAPDARINLLEHNTSLHFNSLLPSDGGFYQCEVTMANMAESKVISLGYLLNFDHWSVSISGPDTVLPGREYTFTCQVNCTVDLDCSIRWPLRGGILTSAYFSVRKNILKWIPSVPGTVQNFTCVVENTAAGRSAEASKTVKVTGPTVSGSETVRLTGVLGLVLCMGLLFLLDP